MIQPFNTLVRGFSPLASRLPNDWDGLWAGGRLAGRLLTCALVVLLAQSFLWSPTAPVVLKLVIVGVAVLSAVRPADALLVVAGLTPFGRIIGSDIFKANPAHFTEALVLAFLAGWLITRLRRPDQRVPGSPALVLLSLFAAVIVASAAVEIVVLRYWKDFWSPFAADVFRHLLRDYLCVNVSWQPLQPGMHGAAFIGSAALWLEGLALVVAVHQLGSGDPTLRRRLVRVLVFAAVGTAVLSVGAAIETAVAAGLGPLAIFSGPRLAVHTGKVNTAASSFVLFIPILVGLVIDRMRREPGSAGIGRVRLATLAMGTTLLLVALWLTGSRAGFVAILLVALAAAAATVAGGRRTSTRSVLAMLAICGIVGLVFVSGLYLRSFGSQEHARLAVAAVGIRQLGALTTVRMLEAHPITGIGVGQYYAQSALFSSEAMSQYAMSARFDAHDQFLQATAELGLVGGVLFSAMFVVILWRAWAAFKLSRDSVLGGAVLGLAAFLATSLAGQPLLIEVVAFPFWLALGLALASSAEPPAGTRGWMGIGRTQARLAAGFLVLLALSIPVRAANALDRVDFAAVTYGVSASQAGEDGRRFQLADGHGTFFLRAGTGQFALATRRHVSRDRYSLDVQVFVDGGRVGSFAGVSTEWQRAEFPVPQDAHRRFRRVDVKVVARSGAQPLVRVELPPGSRIERLPVASLISMNPFDILAHVLNVVHGLGASLACFALLFVCGVALLPGRWGGASHPSEFPALLGAAMYALWCWYGIRLGIPLTTLVAVFAGLVLAVAGVRYRHVGAVLKTRAVFSRATAGWLVTFGVLYIVAYLFFTPSVSGEYLPLASYSNNDLMSYLNHTRYLQQLGPSNVGGTSFLDASYWQTPAVFQLIGLFSAFCLFDPMSAAMPVQFACTALFGLVCARIARSVFRASPVEATAVAAVIISGPFFRYLAGQYLLPTLMATPVLLHMLWTTVEVRAHRRAMAVPLALQFGASYVLLVFLYPVSLVVGIAAQAAIVLLFLCSAVLLGPFTRSTWREAGAEAARTAKDVMTALGVLAVCGALHLPWAIRMVRGFSQRNTTGWPMDLVSPLALFGAPGPFGLIQVDSQASRADALTVLCLIAAVMTMLYFGLFRRRTSPAERVFAGLSAGALVAYCVFYRLVGPSYLQWRFASYVPLPLSFVVFAAGLRVIHLTVAFVASLSITASFSMSTGIDRLIHFSFSSASSSWLMWSRRVVTATAVIVAAVCVGGNLRAHLRDEPPLPRFPAGLRNLALIDDLPGFRDLTVQMSDYRTGFLPVYFIRTKTLHLTSPSYYPQTPVSFEEILETRPFLLHNYSCDGVGHGNTVTIPQVGCLLLGPPSIVLDTSYPFNRSFLPVTVAGLSPRDSWGRWNERGSVQLTLAADSQRTRRHQNAYVNLRLAPYGRPGGGQQRLVFSWGANRHAETSIGKSEWISLPVQDTDWVGNRLQNLGMSLDLPDAVLPREYGGDANESRLLAVGFYEVSISGAPRGRVVSPDSHGGH